MELIGYIIEGLYNGTVLSSTFISLPPPPFFSAILSHPPPPLLHPPIIFPIPPSSSFASRQDMELYFAYGEIIKSFDTFFSLFTIFIPYTKAPRKRSMFEK